jgi:outer membrane protein assembly factor BamB
MDEPRPASVEVNASAAEVMDAWLDALRAPVQGSPAPRPVRPGRSTGIVLIVALVLGVALGGALYQLGAAWLRPGQASLLGRPAVPGLRPRPPPAVDGATEPGLVPLNLRYDQTVDGLLQFRGNPARTYYGEGPLPDRPKVLWRFPETGAPMCAESWVGDESSVWCGTGWTGQPAVWERADGVTEVVFGAYDKSVHFLDVGTGRRLRPDYRTGDIIKGSVTLDADGDPLVYFGSRDNRLRIVALDRPEPKLLWDLPADFVHGIWNNDWDGNPVVLDDLLLEGGENGYFFAFQLHRDYDDAGLVQLQPELLVAYRGWTESLLQQVGDDNASIENSVTVFEDRVYFANSAGRVVGLDLREVREGRAPVVFDFWLGDDMDASLVVDEQGMLYAAVELERFLPRSDEVGQLVKLDPHRPDDPVVWSLTAPPGLRGEFKGGIWATPALADGVLYVPTNGGQLLVVDADTGEVTWVDELGPHAWSSPVVVDGSLLVATCKGELRRYDLEDPLHPRLVWSFRLRSEACIESTPAVWKGKILVGARDGYFYAIGDAPQGPQR